MIGTKTAIVGTAVLHGSVPAYRHLRGLDEHFAATPIIVDIIGYEHTIEAVLMAALQHVDSIVFKNDFRVRSAETLAAK